MNKKFLKLILSAGLILGSNSSLNAMEKEPCLEQTTTQLFVVGITRSQDGRYFQLVSDGSPSVWVDPQEISPYPFTTVGYTITPDEKFHEVLTDRFGGLWTNPQELVPLTVTRMTAQDDGKMYRLLSDGSMEVWINGVLKRRLPPIK